MVWGNISEMRVCIFGGFHPFLFLYWCSGSDAVPFPLPLPEPCVGFSLWDSLPSPQTSTETTLGGCNGEGGVEAGVSPWWTSRTLPHVTLFGSFSTSHLTKQEQSSASSSTSQHHSHPH